MKILLFYDNFVRDFRGLLLLKALLEELGNECYLRPLWQDAKKRIEEINPDTVIMGQIGEHSTSTIGRYVHDLGINLVLNTTEFITRGNNFEDFLLFNRNYLNTEVIDLQVLPNRSFANYVRGNREILCKEKYKLIGIPRLDLTINPVFRYLEMNSLKKKYGIKKNTNVFLYLSSFVYDEVGGQIEQENMRGRNFRHLLEEELKEKEKVRKILIKFAKKIDNGENLLLIKKHPWDKSTYFEENIKRGNIIIVDNFEYSSSLIAICNFFLHSQSTAVLEAWIQNKKTISILPSFDQHSKRVLDHMKHEVIVRNYKELIEKIVDYPRRIPGRKALEDYQPFLDGRATVRLAKEISKMEPKKGKKIFKSPLKEKLILKFMNIKENAHKSLRRSLLKQDLFNHNSYAYLLSAFERQKRKVQKLYREPIEDYVKTNFKLINED